MNNIQSTITAIPLYSLGGTFITSIPHNEIDFYNVQTPTHSNTYRVGISTYKSRPVHIFDHNGTQWAEFTISNSLILPFDDSNSG